MNLNLPISWNLPHEWKSPYSRVMIGPLESALPYASYRVRGLLDVPIPVDEPKYGMVLCKIQRWQFNIPVCNSFLREKWGRQRIQEDIKHEFYYALMEKWPIRMTIERFDYGYSSDSLSSQFRSGVR